ncbi:MAG: HAD-IA family hydrolase [Alphaproteobacteria bacterium]|nr:HAD-IA family hydrolase [Alphaproteobacteria bacterium]
MIQAVIFDFGGVITESPFEAFAKLERERGLPQDFIRRINATNPHDNAWARFERSELDLAGFDEAFAEEAQAAGHSLRGADVLSCLNGALRPAMVTALERIRARTKTGCITNNVKNDDSTSSWRSADVARVMEMFHHVIESSKVGVRKPDPRIYAMMVDALGVDPKACVYLDDLGINLKPAREMGMTTIKVQSGAQALADLEAATGFTLR